jgi:hypothetical protein
VAWSSRFRLHHRVAKNPREGRILPAGDDARLDARAAQRHRIAAGVIAFTDRLTRMATGRNLAMASAGRLPPVRAALANRLAELDTR